MVTRNETSIMQDLSEIKELVDEMQLGGCRTGKSLRQATCDECDHPLEWIQGHCGTDDEPPSLSGFWCDHCEVFTPY